MSECSKILESRMVFKIECMHCDAINYVSYNADEQYGPDVEELTCWVCKKDSLISEDGKISQDMRDMHPNYPEESVDNFKGSPLPPMQPAD